jgi:glycosyltransferase involved in cell wall biosynthesis
MIKIADITTVVSSYERDYLEKELNAPRVEVLSNIHQCTTVLPVYEDTQGIVFIGGYNHRPNVQGIVWFVNEVWPLVNEQIRNQGLIIAGSNAPIEVFNLQQRNIQVVGWVNDSQALVRRSRLSIAPLLTGAGVKGKIGEALSQGIPVVATSIATEGMHFESNQHGIVADTPSDFANAINALYDSVDQWHLFQRSGLDLIRKHYSIDVAKEKFLEITNSLGH